MLAFYKHPKLDIFKCNISIDLTNRPVVDIGGSAPSTFFHCCESVYQQPTFAFIQWPSGMLTPPLQHFEVLGSIVGHMISQDRMASLTSARRASTILLLERIKH